MDDQIAVLQKKRKKKHERNDDKKRGKMMELKDMTDLIRVYDAYKRIEHMMDLMVGGVLPDEGTVMAELDLITEVIARNSVLFQRDSKDPMFDVENSEHADVLNDIRLTAEQRAFRLLDIVR